MLNIHKNNHAARTVTPALSATELGNMSKSKRAMTLQDVRKVREIKKNEKHWVELDFFNRCPLQSQAFVSASISTPRAYYRKRILLLNGHKL